MSNDNPRRHRSIKAWHKCTLMLALAVAALPNRADVADVNGPASIARLVAAGGHVILMRHALAPGTGDPPGFSADDCATQRNLSEAGRAQASGVGRLLRSLDIDRLDVFSSRWCRARETAELLSFGDVVLLPALDSFFRQPDLAEPRTREILEWIEQRPSGPSAVLVTHQVNITALTGIFPASGEMLVMRAEGDALRLVGRIPAS